MNDASYLPYLKTQCRYCESPLGRPFLDMGIMPLANAFPEAGSVPEDEFRCPLALTRCPECSLVQLTHVVPPDLMFSHYLYVSSTTQTFRDHFAAYAKSVKSRLPDGPGRLAVDIGSNDGLLLACYEKEGLRAVGVDPAANLSEDANRRGLKTLNRYFDAECVRAIISEHGKAHAVSGNNVFAHIDDIASVCRNVHDLLDDDGLFVIEFPYLPVMFDELVFDMIYHEHLSYIALTPLAALYRRFGLEIFDVEKVSSHGGSLRVFAQKKGSPRPVGPTVAGLLAFEMTGGYLSEDRCLKFAHDVYRVRDDFVKLVAGLNAAGKKIAGYGAAAKASTMANFYGLHAGQIDYVVDDNPLKQNRLVPGARIPISPGSRLESETPDFVIIFAWNFAAEILKKIGFLQKKGTRFLLPMPNPDSRSGVNSPLPTFEITPRGLTCG